MGWLLKLKNGNIYLVLKPFGYAEFILVRAEGWVDSIHYDDNLQYTLSDGHSIVKMHNLCENKFSTIIKEESEINLSNFELLENNEIENNEIKNNKILNKLNSIQNQLDEIKNIIS